jgi:hypothetical protein
MKIRLKPLFGLGDTYVYFDHEGRKVLEWNLDLNGSFQKIISKTD